MVVPYDINTVFSGKGINVCSGAGTGTGTGTTSIPVPDSSLSSVQHQSGTGQFGKIGTISTSYYHIVTSSFGALAPSVRAPQNTHTPRAKTLANIDRCYTRFTDIKTTHMHRCNSQNELAASSDDPPFS